MSRSDLLISLVKAGASGDQDEATLQTLGELLRVALKLRGQSGAVSP